MTERPTDTKEGSDAWETKSEKGEMKKEKYCRKKNQTKNWWEGRKICGGREPPEKPPDSEPPIQWSPLWK